MAQILIREKDLTGNPASSVFDVAFVPGLTINDLESIDTETGKRKFRYDYGKPYYFNSLASFQSATAMGERPVRLTGSGVKATINGEEMTFFAEDEGVIDNGYIYACELLAKGMPIYYMPIKGTSAQDVYDALGGDGDYSRSVLYQLVDRGTFNIKYLTSGGYPTFEYNNNEIVKKMLIVAGATENQTWDYNDNPEAETPNGRGDCVALIDHFEVDDRPLLGTGSVLEQINKPKSEGGLAGNPFLSYGAMFTPYANYRLSKTYLYRDADDKDVTFSTHYLPASFAYMTCLAAQLGGVLPSYEAIAGVAKGSVKNIVFDSVTNSYQMCTKDILTNYIANRYNTLPGADETDGEKISISINGITQINPYGMVIYGTRTLMEKSPIDGVKATGWLNIRNMVSDIKKQMYQSARRYMYSANNDALWINFRSSVVGLLNQLQQGYGIKSYTLAKDMAKSTKYSLYVRCSIVPVYPVEKFDITIEITDEDIEVNEV